MEVPQNQLMQIVPTGTYNMQNVVRVKQLVASKAEKDEAKNVKSCQIKSSAIDLFTAAPIPATFFKLENNTDLNRPPINWLSKPRQILGFPLHTRNVSPSPASFQMASSFLDCVGEVDVISDAENIKKLLKIPYSKSQVSMMVHRIGKTLLLDDFDIHTHLLRTAENEWAWLRKFYLEHIFASLQPKGKDDERKTSRHSRTYLQQQNLIAKFLYHSLVSESSSAQSDDGGHNVQKVQQQTFNTHSSHQEHQEHPTVDSSMPQFSKNIIWTFEDIRMLIGTDLPIFGGKTHPCLSLRLRDMNKPINVLTGIDYWLDNLMSNVPEVVMCYHLGGLVQKYELIKTEDLPRMPNSSFKPSVIRDVAQNILSFLKSKATKPGHTYWLFKGRGDDIVKLYDLTSLCSDMNEDPGQNPFTTPVAMLLFKVAKNLKTSDDWRRHQATILALLTNCLEIIDMEKYPQIATAALYYMADIYLPVPHETGMNGEESTEITEDDWESGCEDADIEDRPMSTSADDSDLTSQNSEKEVEPSKMSSPLHGDWKQRAVASLENAVKALKCLSEKVRTNEPSSEADGPALASPLRPIPMPYIDSDNKETECSIVTKEPLSDWKSQWWRLLLEKCVAAYVTLAELTVKQPEPDWEECLFYLRMANLLWLHMDESPLVSISAGSDVHLSPLHSLALGLAGDAYFLLVQQWAKLEHPLKDRNLSESDENLLHILNTQNKSADISVEKTFPYPTSIQQSLELSFSNYKLALKVSESLPEPDSSSLCKRFGNVCNELGVFYMSRASNLVDGNQPEWKAQFFDLFQNSLKYLDEGVTTFKSIQDSSNTALLLSNLGKLYRLQAKVLAPSEVKEITITEWKCYSKVLQCYKEALELPNLFAGIVDAVVWEYTSVLFTLASLLQDFAPLSIKSREEIENEISGLLGKCVELCDVKDSNVRQPLYQYRSATCHYRLASLYHDSYRNGNGEAVINGKNVRTLAETHYIDASVLYQNLENWEEFLRIQLEKIGLHEFHLKHLSGTGSKMRTLRLALNCLLSTAPAVSALAQSSGDDTKNSECLEYVCTRLHSVLLQMTKLSKKMTSKNPVSDEQVYKKMYLVSLKCSPKEAEFRRKLPVVIEEIVQLSSSSEKK